jgi:hypothetical protein
MSEMKQTPKPQDGRETMTTVESCQSIVEKFGLVYFTNAEKLVILFAKSYCPSNAHCR